MTGYANAATGFLVIEADDRDPHVSFRNHLARGSAGGVDLVARIGTPLRAPADCTLQRVPWYGSGGHTVRLFHGNGNYDEYMHLSAWGPETGARVRQGDVVGFSGASGYGLLRYYDPHWHWHLYVGGVRVNPWNYFTAPWPGSSPAGADPQPIPIREDTEHMTEALYKGSGSDTVYWQRDPNSPLVPISSPQYAGQLAAGLKLVTISDADLAAIRTRFGVLQRPAGSTATGLAYRDRDSGAIYWQREPGTELVPITWHEWQALQQNGLTFVDYAPADLAAIRARAT